MNKWLLFLIIPLFLFGCNDNHTEETTKNNTQFTKLSTTKEQAMDQTPSNRVKDLLSEEEAVTKVNAVNNSDTLLIAFEIEHMERFRLVEIEEDLKKEMKKQFEDYKVELSTDQKIVLELDDLEAKIKDDSINEKKLKKEMDRIIKLSREKT